MHRDKDREIDDFFKNAMQHDEKHIDYREHDWELMQQMLDERRVRPVVVWMRFAGGIAAMLLLALGWWFFDKDNSRNDNDKQQITITKPHPQAPESLKNEQPVNLDSITTPEKQAFAGRTAKGVAGRVVPVRHNPVPVNFLPVESSVENKVKVDDSVAQNQQVIANNGVTRNDTTATQTEVLAQINSPVEKSAKSSEKELKVEAIKTRPTFTLSILASPDVNAVSAFNNSKVGCNFGAMLSVNLGNKFTVSTGAFYSVKPYAATLGRGITYYGKPTTVQQNVMADCRVLDIPLNVDYKLYSKQRNSIYIGTGLSSYFMLRENYTYTGGQGYNGTQGNSFSVSNQNRHILGVLNLQATYQRQLNSRVGIAVQPFMKLPLTDIGYGNVRLRSAGVAVGLNWNISKTPKATP